AVVLLRTTAAVTHRPFAAMLRRALGSDDLRLQPLQLRLLLRERAPSLLLRAGLPLRMLREPLRAERAPRLLLRALLRVRLLARTLLLQRRQHAFRSCLLRLGPRLLPSLLLCSHGLPCFLSCVGWNYALYRSNRLRRS